MANLIVSGGKYVTTQNITGSGNKLIALATQNKFVDKNIEITVSTPAGSLSAGSTTASVTDAESLLTEVSTAPSSGEYITVSAQGNVYVGTGGFIAENTGAYSAPLTKYYTVQNATFTVDGASVKTNQKGYVGNNVTVGTISNGTLSIDGGTLSDGAKSVSIASNGLYNGTTYDTSDKVALSTTQATGYYKITGSGSATVNRAAVTKQITAAGYFAADESAVTEIEAGSKTVLIPDQAYYIKKSTLSTNSVTPSTGIQTVTIGEGYYPSARTVTVAAMTGTTVTTSLSNTGLSTYFTTGTSSNKDVSITPQFSNAAGFVPENTNTNNGGIEYYKIRTTSVTGETTTVSGGTATRGSATWGTGWVTSGSLSPAAFKNTATTGTTYVDISSTNAAPVLSSGGYLYIDAGYTDNLRISLAKLVPDGSDVKGHSEYILQNHSAYDDDGVLVSGSIPTYQGEFTVSTPA